MNIHFSNCDHFFGHVTFFISIPYLKGQTDSNASSARHKDLESPCLKKCPLQILSDAIVLQMLGKESSIKRVDIIES